MSQRDIRVKLEMIQKDLSTKKTHERRLMVSNILGSFYANLLMC